MRTYYPAGHVAQDVRRDLKQEKEFPWEDFEAAVKRAVYAVVRAGVVAPDNIMEEYGFSAVKPPLDESDVPRLIKKRALTQAVHISAENTLESINFARNPTQSSYNTIDFISSCAASAETGTGLAAMKDICDWHYPRSNIPGGNWLYNYVTERLSLDNSSLSDYETTTDSLPAPDINEQFDAVRRRTLNFTREHGFWSDVEPVNVAIDMFRLDWSGESLDETIDRPPKSKNDDITEEWTFVLATCVDNKCRFALGARLITEKSEYPEAVDEILSNATECIDIGTILIDSEIVGEDLIGNIREVVDHDWIISAPDTPIIKGLKRLTPDNHIGFAPNVTHGTTHNAVIYPFNGSDPKVVRISPENVAANKIRNEGNESEKIDVPLQNPDGSPQQTLSENSHTIPRLVDEYDDVASQSGVGTTETHAAYFTDRPMSDRSAASVRFDYFQRWSVEDAIDKITNEFLPTIESSDPNQRIFGVNVAILMYNWYILVNRAVSPYLLRLDISPSELRKAIQHVGFAPNEISF